MERDARLCLHVNWSKQARSPPSDPAFRLHRIFLKPKKTISAKLSSFLVSLALGLTLQYRKGLAAFKMTSRAEQGRLKDFLFLNSTSICVLVLFSTSRNVCTAIKVTAANRTATKHACCTREIDETTSCASCSIPSISDLSPATRLHDKSD
jgi:hypothetical protein